MKNLIKNFLVVSVLTAGFVAAQGVLAKEDLDCGTVVGTELDPVVVCAIDYDLNAITVCSVCPDENCVTVQGIPLNYLAKWEELDLQDQSVWINAHECPVAGTLMACDLTVDMEDPAEDLFFELRQGGLGKNGNQGN